MRRAVLLGLVHATVDAATVTAVYRAGGFAPAVSVAIAWVVAYDVVAFGLQPALGWLQDRRFSPRIGMALGLVGAAAAVVTASAVPEVRGALACVVLLAALGNAMFHLGAGATILGETLERATPVGLLVAPGAAGLAVGVWFGRNPAAGPTWWALLPLLLGALLTAQALRTPAAPRPATRVAGGGGRWGERLTEPVTDVAAAVVGLLLLSVAIRALVGGSAARGYDAGLWLGLGLPIVAVAGKSLGGLIADRWGWTRTTVAALLVASPLLAFQQPHPVLLLLGLLVFQLTMPVTLVAVARMLREHLATGFGLTCLALVGGALPTLFEWGDALAARPVLGAWVLLSAGVAWAGLTGSGLRWRRTPPAHAPVGPPMVAQAAGGASDPVTASADVLR